MTARESSRPGFSNTLLRSLPGRSFDALHPMLEPVALPVRTKLAEAGKTTGWLYFPETGIASIVSQRTKSWQEIGIFGREGVGCHSPLLGSPIPCYTVLMQIGGHGHRIRSDLACQLADRDVEFRMTLLRYVHVLTVQVSQTAVANVQCNIAERLARWILMLQDRMGEAPLAITHEFLATMLGVARTGVTLALQDLEEDGMIGTGRKRITVLDRLKLERVTGNHYGFAEAEYQRLLASHGGAAAVGTAAVAAAPA